MILIVGQSILLRENNYRCESMKQKWKPMQFVEISMHEIFAFQDKLDAVKDDPEKVWDVVDDFFMECENQLELSPGFIKELSNIKLEDDFVPLSIETIDDLYNDEDFEQNYFTAQDYVNYVFTKADVKRYDIPFSPRHDF